MIRRVLIVEDEPEVAALYEGYLADQYDVEVVNTGEDALDALDAETDAVLLDRRLPDMAGSEVLTAIRDRGFDCRVAMVTAVEPDVDIVEMGFDLYLVKPATRDDIHTAVERLGTRANYDEKLRRTAALVTKRALLEAERPRSELRESSEYDALLDRIEKLQADLDDLGTAFAPDDYRMLFRSIGETNVESESV
ncbi:HalX domain-containing protein [Candidatus Halobonum tyrrellensis]|uniref:Response regulator receiver protein n=1 Tax=Candidatus Halobonum tyrrellensis G22 TaxID=1324957 RepID=V4HFP6_9EURY|nr:HalX domain-containing protein [Candidatus Halobonum tyrrellensis]ESP89515.1 response regulator receiver protein [Candidatus Halobonum tyrrellensis G22]